jgi:hypothetical protein
MWLVFQVVCTLLAGLVGVSTEPMLIVCAGGALMLYQPRGMLQPSAPVLSSLPQRERNKVLQRGRVPTAAWWLGMGFASGLLLSSACLFLLSLPKIAIPVTRGLVAALAEINVDMDQSHGPSARAQGDLSQSGIARAGVSPRQAFERADAILAARHVSQADWFEARAWLLHGLSDTHDRETLAWAFVQLGSSHIYGSRRPDIVLARRYWQMAGLLGDRVALCFEAEIERHGLAGEQAVGAVTLSSVRTVSSFAMAAP